MSFFGESAKEALRWAKDAYERVVKIEQRMEGVAEAVRGFEQRNQQAQQAFEQRMERRVTALEDLVRGELRGFEERLRILERDVGRVEAKVDGGFAEAAGLIFADAAANRRQSAIEAITKKPAEGQDSRLGDGTTNS